MALQQSEPPHALAAFDPANGSLRHSSHALDQVANASNLVASFINSAREDPSLFRGWGESAAPLMFWTHPLARPIGLTLMKISDTLVPSYIDNGRVFR